MKYPDHLLKLIAVLKKLPGVGSKTAERFAFHLINCPAKDLEEMGGTIGNIKQNLKHCPECGCLVGTLPCPFCDIQARDARYLCVIASAKDAFLIEETRQYQGFYHVLGGLLSPIQGRGADFFLLEKLKKRVHSLRIEEIIIALDSTLEGDATSLFLKKELAGLDVSISRLALGLPMGSSLDFIDGGTLANALSGRRTY